jgi:hypothetical protein
MPSRAIGLNDAVLFIVIALPARVHLRSGAGISAVAPRDVTALPASHILSKREKCGTRFAHLARG